MKSHLLILSALLFSVLGFSQGIEFEHGTWTEVLAKAKQTNKPIFVDIYTSWCGPCKKMSNEVFPLAEVGKVYNSSFICYKIDAEKGEGVKIAKQYEVNSYPTYLFVKADGTLIMKGIGSMTTVKFIALSQSVKDELSNPKILSEWEKEYTHKKTDPIFLLAYMNKRSQLGKPNTELFDEYLALLPIEQRASNEIVEIYQKESRNIKLGSLAYRNLQDNSFLFFPKLGGYVYILMSGAIDNSFREATKSKNEQLLQQVVEANEKLPKTQATKQKEEYYMNYYKATDNMEKYISNAIIYCEGSLMNVTSDSIAKMDKKTLELFETQKIMFKGKLDSAQLAATEDYMTHASRNKYSGALNEVAWNFFEKVGDTKALLNALSWSKRSTEIYPDNHMYIDTYANLLYKLGQKQEAINNEKEALKIATKAKADTKEYEITFKKMNSGEKTWK